MSASAPTGDRPAAPSLATALRGGAARRRPRRDPDAPGTLAAVVPDRDALVDLGFAAVLCSIALVGMRTGFLGVEWVVAAWVGLLLGLLVGHLAGALRWMALTTFLVLTATYFLLGGPVAVRDNLLGGVVPTPQTFVDLATWAVTGWKKWLTLLPPVDARGAVVALPWLAGLLGGALTLGVARRWASIPLTALAPIALLAASIALGTSQPAALLVQGVGFAAVLVAWLVVRSHRTRPPVQNGAGRGVRLATGAALAVVALLAGTFAGPALPGTSATERREVVRTRLVPPLDVSQFASPLPGYRRYTEPNDAKLYDQVVLRVQGLPAGTPVRFATLDHYDGLVWGAADRSSDGVPFQQVGSRIAAAREGESAEVRVSVPDAGYVGNWLPTVGDPTRIEFSGPRADELADALWLNTETDTAVVQAGLLGGETYAMTAVLGPTPARELPKDLDVASGASTGVDTDFLDARIDAWTSRAEGGPWSKLRAFATAMRTEGTYTDGGTPNSFEKVYLPGHAVSRLTRFVGSSKLAGNDEQYAATLALVGQRLGIPTRVVMGATPQAGGDVRGKDVHAWVEVRLDDGTWYPLGAQTFVPSRDKTPSEQQLKTEEQKVGAQVPPPAGVSPPSVLQGPDQAQNATDLAKRKKNPFDVTAWPLWLQVLAGLVALAALVALYLVGMRWLKRRRRRKHVAAGPVPGRAAWVWRDLVAEARSLGVAVPRRVTRREQAHAIDAAVLEASLVPADEGAPAPAAALPDDVVTVSSVAGAVDAVVFGPGDGDPASTDALHEHAEAALTTMRSGVGRWTRVRSDADPRPLLVRRERTAPAGPWWRRVRVPSLPRRGGSDPTPA
ncbi:transglutaminase-like domain-containing protein [Phycicoccus sonneratiae]|uniref:Transglutaminase domain-containing protein n=1 Tax=Phycicoccus sonneratiae TaxID=2807628 RepID=A0ABS2CN83_9MICO|nr:transglutaminase-like domain-containing protein [Phycicoccus sonneraticus]MBM6401280.1 transglutaminase domain-containing protein [Phycicoccus sonneraticus]